MIACLEGKGHMILLVVDTQKGCFDERLYAFDIAFDIVDKRLGTQKVEVIGIRMDRPINHLENKDR
jgi:hypothetical protein